MASSTSKSGIAAAGPDGSPYPYPTLAVSSFVAVELRNKDNYRRWREAMLLLMESHGMLGFINGDIPNPKENIDKNAPAGGMTSDPDGVELLYKHWKRSDDLLKGWTTATMSEEVLAMVKDLDTAKAVWTQLETTYHSSHQSNKEVVVNEEDVAKYLPLYKAALMSDWGKAEEILAKYEEAITAKIAGRGKTVFHIAVVTGTRGIPFLKKLLDKIQSAEVLLTLKDEDGSTALDYAACVGNTKATKMLVEKNPFLLYTEDDSGMLPIHSAAYVSQRETCLYLLEATKMHLSLCQHEYGNPFEGRRGLILLNHIVTAGFFDMALKLINDHPELARVYIPGMKTPLRMISIKSDAYYSGN